MPVGLKVCIIRKTETLFSFIDGLKSAEERQEEEYLIKRKMELVEERNMIIDSMDEDRLR